jgi:hypothetical protein
MKEFIDGITIEYIKNRNKCKSGRCLKIRGDRLDHIEEQIEMMKELASNEEFLESRELDDCDYDNEEEHYCDDCDNIITIRYNLYHIYNKYA